jgi:hypothetical protein
MTEVFVSIDNLEFTKLDLSKDESILMKYTQKIYKIYLKSLRLIHKTLIFLQRQNRMAFGFFGDTEIVKVNTEEILVKYTRMVF